jgi:nucleoside-diphosphate-sugar epimerase
VGAHVLAAFGKEARGLYRGELGEWTEPNLRRAFASATGVVHSASIVHRPGTSAKVYERFNVDGTRALLDAAVACGVRRVVFLSSIKVYGEAPEGVIDEHTPVRAEAPYAHTKALAEALVLERKTLAPVVLRLCPVYGRGDKGNVRTIIRAIARRRFFVPGDGSTRKSIVHVSRVADVVRASARGEATGTFVVADRHAPSTRELADTIAKLLGRRRPTGLPKRVLRSAAGAIQRLARLAGRETAISAELIDKSVTSSVCDPSAVERAFGVSCSTDLESALADEVAWLRSIGEL